MLKVARFFLHIVYTILMAVAILCIVITCTIYWYGRHLPDHWQLSNYQPPTVTRVYGAQGQLIAEYAKEHRIFTAIEDIPKHIINAFIAAEDKNFYNNQGVDFSGVVKAAIKNVYKLADNKRMVGGSTITQQVVKNFLLSNERTLKRKIKEAILAYRVNSSLTKDKIMELYLNHIYLGNGSYGISSAALKYLSKSINEISIDEAALLAALPKAPSKLNPIKSPRAAEQRRNWVLQRMYDDGYIDEVSKKIFQSIPLSITTSSDQHLIHNDFFVEEVRKNLIKKYGEDALYTNGLTVHTTLNLSYQNLAKIALKNGLENYDQKHGWRGAIQNIADELLVRDYNWASYLINIKQLYPNIAPWKMAVVLNIEDSQAEIGLENGSLGTILLSDIKWAKAWIDNSNTGSIPKKMEQVLKIGDVIMVSANIKSLGCYNLKQIPKINGAIVVMEPNSGSILAMVGGYNYNENQFNRATQALRQPGSIFKTFVYLAALENGLTPNTIALDDHISIEQGTYLPLWQPRNIGNTFMGPITVRTGFEQSRNLITVRLAKFLGMDKINDTIKKLNIHNKPLNNYASVLGSEVVSLMTMTRAYAIIANGGYNIQNHMIERIQDARGSDIYKVDYLKCARCNLLETAQDFQMLTPLPPLIHKNSKQLIDPVHTYQMTSLLEGSVKNGTSKPAKIKNQFIAGKTGTTNGNMDAWFIGFTNNLVVGVYTGFDSPECLGKKETGSRIALPIFKNFMLKALAEQPSQPFKIPIGVNIVTIDQTTGVPIKQITNPNMNNIMHEALRIGEEDKILSIIERKHYYDADHNKWMIAINDDDLDEIINELSEDINNDTIHSNTALTNN
ncbi:Penicillin-insensitive transglycosylase / Penicillin-sensitive transpeptidase [Candidatus Xenohaliotis californiensis]|uniref:Penicillin-binding protein 1A n=1 Tax=Candidatus Xenohaliotis californiensis TaxID=84677 RepID=A0ABP0EXU0_9RICK|nr:Penicillin-insensitive transglycosylase / Penicillin-sensitive transpeptidase [Candidatus Xenohaliotis californiensis]